MTGPAGGDAPMSWSHADAATYRTWLTAAGFDVEHEEFVPEGDGGHALVRARRVAVDQPGPAGVPRRR